MTVWGVDGHTCVQRPLLLLGMCALDHARVQACEGTCVCLQDPPFSPAGLRRLAIGTAWALMLPRWEVAWGSDPRPSACLCPQAVPSQCEGPVFLCQLWGPAEPFALCQNGAHHCSWGSWAVKANRALGAQVWGRAAPLGFVPLVLPGH